MDFRLELAINISFPLCSQNIKKDMPSNGSTNEYKKKKKKNWMPKPNCCVEK